MKKHLRMTIAVIITGLLTGACAGHKTALQPPVEPPASATEAPVAAETPQTVASEGSLWNGQSALGNLFIDTKARKIGDIVTVEIKESATATNEANTSTGRDSSLEAGIEKLFGLEDWWQNEVLENADNDLPKIDPFGNPSVKGSIASGFEGTGRTTRSGDLSAFITCRVTEVLPNGNLRIVGTREVLVNHENQLIVLSGVIRPRDITQENVIESTFVSDAKIAYSGTGVIDDRQRPGWLANWLNTVWPF
jgi:flagellar L-ring protein precursor FlgH